MIELSDYRPIPVTREVTVGEVWHARFEQLLAFTEIALANITKLHQLIASVSHANPDVARGLREIEAAYVAAYRDALLDYLQQAA